MDGDVDLRGPWRAIIRAPMVRIGLPFIMGVLMAWWRLPSLGMVSAVFACATPAATLVLLFPGERLSRWQRGAVVSFWFLAFGLFWQVARSPGADPLHVERHGDREGPWALQVEAINGASEKVLRADATLIALMRNDTIVPRRGRVMLTLLLPPDGEVPRRGDRLLVDAALTPISRIPDPGGFDRRAWAASRGIAMELFAPSAAWRTVDHNAHWTHLFANTRDRISTWLDGSDMPMRERAVVKALVLGQRDELDGEQRAAFARSGTIHVLAVSGMHVGLIYAILSFLFGWWGKSGKARMWRGLFVLLALWAYAGLTGASPSVMRATVMFSLFTLAGMAAQRTDHLNSLFAAALLLLLYDPALLGVIGFQLSFLAVLGIIVFYKPIERLWSPADRILRGIWSLAVVSIAAQLLTTPLSLHLFQAFPVWFLPANIIVVTAVGLAVNGAVALLLLYKVPVIGPAITWAMTMLLKTVASVTAFFASLPGAYPEVRVGPAAVVLLYILILAVAAWWQWKWRSMRWVAGLACGALLVVWGAQAREARQRASFVVYDERGPVVAAMTQGRELVVHASDPGLLHDGWIARKLERHCRAHGLAIASLVGDGIIWSDGPQQHGPTLAMAGRWRSPAFDVVFVRDDHDPPKAWQGGRLDAVVVDRRRWLDEADLETIATMADRLVLGGELPWRVRDKALRWCTEHGVPVHDVRGQGAFVLTKRLPYNNSM
ncbi:MAG: ComEC/Rec2 family competence protein [Flavobacteriales bacterium]|nr:ComEC/Rec2 family competence protein [Flavobacteriales bacterium]